MESLLIFDADNTLWDTDCVFREAQIAMLQVLEEVGLLQDASAQLPQLRTLDQALVRRLAHAEYDFQILATALVYFYSHNLSSELAVERTLAEDTRLSEADQALVMRASQALQEGLMRIPSLYSDASAVLSSIRMSSSAEHPIAMVVFSEGRPDRLERILQAYNIRGLGIFDELIIAPKTLQTFEQAKQAGLRHLSSTAYRNGVTIILVGDSLERDIKLGNQAGMLTVYKPSPYKGVETPCSTDDEPCYTIGSLSELPSILRDLGLPIHPPIERSPAYAH